MKPPPGVEPGRPLYGSGLVAVRGGSAAHRGFEPRLTRPERVVLPVGRMGIESLSARPVAARIGARAAPASAEALPTGSELSAEGAIRTRTGLTARQGLGLARLPVTPLPRAPPGT